jgi:hypothetical protein
MKENKANQKKGKDGDGRSLTVSDAVVARLISWGDRHMERQEILADGAGKGKTSGAKQMDHPSA